MRLRLPRLSHKTRYCVIGSQHAHVLLTTFHAPRHKLHARPSARPAHDDSVRLVTKRLTANLVLR